MTTPTAPETPELDRRRAVIESGRTETLTNFIEWLNAHGYAIVRRCQDPVHETGRSYCGGCSGTGYVGPVYDFERLLSAHFGLDPVKIEAEMRLVLDHQRALNDAS